MSRLPKTLELTRLKCKPPVRRFNIELNCKATNLNELPQEKIEILKNQIKTADTIIIGEGSGLSTAAGYVYTGERFQKYFGDFGVATFGLTVMRQFRQICIKNFLELGVEITPFELESSLTILFAVRFFNFSELSIL